MGFMHRGLCGGVKVEAGDRFCNIIFGSSDLGC